MHSTIEKFGIRVGRYLLKQAQMHSVLPMPPTLPLEDDQTAQLLMALQQNALRRGIGGQKKKRTATEKVPKVVTIAK